MNKNTDNNKQTDINEYIKKLEPIGTMKDVFIRNRQEYAPQLSTGWHCLDIALNGGLTNELYIMGAETSTGKSAFMMSLAQNLARQGTNVLYYSLEMSKEEFIARSISAISFVANAQDASKQRVTTGEILYWTYNQELKCFEKLPYSTYEEYADEYFNSFGNHLYIIEAGIKGLSGKKIADISKGFKDAHHDEPLVVIVDYLQILKADEDDRSQNDRKTKTDVAVTALKSLASQGGMPVLLLSSVSRSNYNGKISTASFKESGDTEYTGGILIGWNWHGVTDAAKEDEREYEKSVCDERGYRIMEFEILKYRNGKRDNKVELHYYPAYNYIVDQNDCYFDRLEENPFENEPLKTIDYVLAKKQQNNQIVKVW